MARWLSVLALVATAAPLPAGAQCAMCNTAVDAARAGRAFSVSVLFLLATLLGLVVWLAVIAARASAGVPPGPEVRGTGAQGGPGGGATGSPAASGAPPPAAG